MNIIYARVSTKEQAESNKVSLNDQIKHGHAYYDSRGIDNVKEFREDESGFNWDRTEFKKIRNLIQSGNVENFYVYNLNRLGRDSVHINQFVMDYIIPNGVTGYSEDIGTWGDDSSGLMTIGIHGVVAQYNALNLVEKLHNHKKSYLKNNSMVIGGKPVFGYMFDYEYNAKGKKVKTLLVPNPEESKIILKIFNYYLAGSLNDVANRLNAEGIKTPSQFRNYPHVKKGTEWRGNQISKYLNDSVYMGKFIYSKHPTAKRIKPERIIIDVEAIIPLDLWAKVQNKLKDNRNAGKPPKHNYLLSRKLKCCEGHAMYVRPTTSKKELKSGEVKTYRNFYYYCSECMTYINVNKVDSQVAQHLEELQENPQKVKDVSLSEHIESLKLELAEIRTNIKRAKSEISELENYNRYLIDQHYNKKITDIEFDELREATSEKLESWFEALAYAELEESSTIEEISNPGDSYRRTIKFVAKQDGYLVGDIDFSSNKQLVNKYNVKGQLTKDGGIVLSFES